MSDTCRAEKDTLTEDEVHMWHQDQKYTDMLEPLYFRLKANINMGLDGGGHQRL